MWFFGVCDYNVLSFKKVTRSGINVSVLNNVSPNRFESASLSIQVSILMSLT